MASRINCISHYLATTAEQWMATGPIKAQTIKGTCTSNQGNGASAIWERVGNIVTVSGIITKPNASWSIFYGLPTPKYNNSTIGVISGDNSAAVAYTIKISIVNNQGALQVQADPFTNSYGFSCSYLCE